MDLASGSLSSVSVIVSPSLASVLPQHGQFVGDGSTTRSRGRCAGNGARTGLVRVNGRTVVFLDAAAAAVTSSSALEFLELHLQLIEQLAATFRRGAEPIALLLAISSFRCAGLETRAVPHVPPAAAFSASMSSGRVSEVLFT
jgi:hypothetical protein